MPIVTKDVLKTYFNTNDTPDEPEFIDLIDSMLNLAEPGTQTMVGELVAPSVQAEAYNFDAFSFLETSTISLTGSNQFGSSSEQTQSFSGSFHQSGGCDSYFLNNLIVGAEVSPQSCEGGLTIFKNKTIGDSDHPVTQSMSSSLLISSSTRGHLAFDHNEIHQYGNNNLTITSQGDSGTEGNIKFRVGNSATAGLHITSSTPLFIKSDGNVGVGTETPARQLSVVGADVGAPLLQLKNTGSSTGEDVFMAFNRDNTDNQGYTIGLHSGNNEFRICDDGDSLTANIRFSILSNGNVGIGNSAPTEKLTVEGNMSASGLIYASASSADTNLYNTLLIDTASGRFYYTGSYGGGSGGGTTVVANPGSSGDGSLDTITIGTQNFSVGGTGLWVTNGAGIKLTTDGNNVGIGGVPSSVHKLLVYGNGVFSGDVVAYYTSDKRLKDNIKPIENPIEKIKQIGGYSFDWNDNQSTYKGTDFGVIAQEIEEVLPSLVQTREDGYKGVKYDKIVSLLIEAIKDQQKQIDELKKLV